jgi:hypothetical protein
MTVPIKYRISSVAAKPVADSVKGVPLTSLEIDGNFRSLKDNIELSLDNALPIATYTALRAYTGTATTVRITSAGIAGFFTRDADVVTADNGGTVIVDASGRRWKRVFDGPISFRWFGAKADGVIDDYIAINLALASGHKFFVADGAFLVSAGFDLGEGVYIVGAGNRPNYTTFSVNLTDHPVRFVKSGKNTNTNYIFRAGKNCTLDGFGVFGPQSFYDSPLDGNQWLGRAGVYPADTSNPDYGIVIYGESVRLEKVNVMNFGEAGVFGDNATSNNGVCTLESVSVTACKRGISGTLYDSTITNPFVTQCAEANIDLISPATSILGGRVEWGANRGIRIQGAGFQIIGTVVDRNGGPGVEVVDTFGGTIHALIKRNGCGGNGTTGRYGQTYDAVGRFAYRATADEDSCNIKLNGAQVVVTLGTRFQSGQSDTGTGANAPAYNFSLVDGGITTTSNVFQLNVGDGFFSGYPVSGGSSAPAYFNDSAKAGSYVSQQSVESPQLNASVSVRSPAYTGPNGGKLEIFAIAIANGVATVVNGKSARYVYEIFDTGRTGHVANGYKGFDGGGFLSSVGDMNYAGNNLVLTGATGTALKINVSSNDNDLYIENRTGSLINLVMSIRSS